MRSTLPCRAAPPPDRSFPRHPEVPLAKKATRLLLWTTAIGLFILIATVAAAFLLADAEPPDFEQEPEWLHVKLSGSLGNLLARRTSSTPSTYLR